MADNIQVAKVLYKNFEPGSWTTGFARNDLTQLLSLTTVLKVGSGSCPADMLSKSLTFIFDKNGLTVSGNASGKKEMTLSSTDNFFSLTAKPTAVAVKLLLVEYNVCLSSGLYGFHHPSAITLPCRRNIKLWNSCLLFAAALRKSIIPCDETSSFSGTLRGSDVVTCSFLHALSKKITSTNAQLNFLPVIFIGN